MPNAAVQPQIRAQREFVGWNCLLGLSGLNLWAAGPWTPQALPRLSALRGTTDATNDAGTVLAAEKLQDSF